MHFVHFMLLFGILFKEIRGLLKSSQSSLDPVILTVVSSSATQR